MQATPTTRRRPLHVACIVCSIWCRAAKYKLSTVDILYKKVAKIALNVDLREPSLKFIKG